MGDRPVRDDVSRPAYEAGYYHVRQDGVLTFDAVGR